MYGFSVDGGEVTEGLFGIPDSMETEEGNESSYYAALFKERLHPKYRNQVWGVPLGSIQEVAAWQFALLPLVGETRSVALANWLGGEGPSDPEDYLNDVDEMVSLSADNPTKPSPLNERTIGKALEHLKKTDTYVHSWTVEKAKAKAANKGQVLQANVDQEVKKWYADTFQAALDLPQNLLESGGTFLAIAAGAAVLALLWRKR